jgi:hypothetical protein
LIVNRAKRDTHELTQINESSQASWLVERAFAGWALLLDPSNIDYIFLTKNLPKVSAICVNHVTWLKSLPYVLDLTIKINLDGVDQYDGSVRFVYCF